MPKCKYGCGREVTYTLCSGQNNIVVHYTKCPELKKKNNLGELEIWKRRWYKKLWNRSIY